MGHTVQLQWSFNPPAGRQISLADIILPRILESYSLHTPSRSTIQFRTYRSTFPSSPSSSSTEPATKTTSRYLTTINTLPNPLPPGSTALQDNTKEEDITYLFLDDRSAITSHLPTITQTSNGISNSNGVDQTQQTNGTSNSKSTDQPIEIDKDTLDDDGFEIIDKPKNTADVEANTKPTQNDGPSTQNTGSEEVRPKQRQPKRFKCLAVRPTSNVQPMLQSLLSPFVMGYSKSAKAAASTTSSTLPTPTPLAGNSLLLTVLSFTPFTPNDREYTLRLKVFILPNPNATSIFLQVDYTPTQDSDRNSSTLNAGGKGQEQDQDQDQVCRGFLQGCLIDGLNDHRKWVVLDHSTQDDQVQNSRDRDSIFALTRSMRESGFI